MKLFFTLCLFLLPLVGRADTPPPGTVKAKMYTGDGITALTATGGSLNVNVTSAGSDTVNQGNAGSQSWLTSVTASALPTNACKETGGNLAAIVTALASPLPIPSGAATAANQATEITDLAAISTNTAKIPALGQALAASSVPIVLTAAQLTTLTPPTTLAVTQSGTWSVGRTWNLSSGSDSVNVGNFPSTYPVTGTFWQTTQPVSLASVPLASGAATAANQATEITDLAAISTNTAKIPSQGAAATAASTPVNIASDQVVPISAASLPLPTNAATSALQTTGNTSLSSIDGKTPALGQALAAASVPVVLTASQLTTLTPPTLIAVTQSGTWNVGRTWTLSSGTDSVAVTGTFWQATQPISAASLPLPTGAATAAKQPALGTAGTPSADVISIQGESSMTPLKTDGSATTQPISAASLPLPTNAATSALQTTGNTSLSSIDGKTPALGQALAAASVPVVLTASQLTTLTPPASVTVTQATGANLHTVVDSAPTTAVTIAAAVQTKAPVNTTGSGSGAGATVSTVTTLTAPSNAVGFILMNLDSSLTNMRWAVGRAASTTLGQQLQPGRDSGFVPIGANVSIIAESGTCNYDIQWVAQ